jgi:hypothetical protein
MPQRPEPHLSLNTGNYSPERAFPTEDKPTPLTAQPRKVPGPQEMENGKCVLQ